MTLREQIKRTIISLYNDRIYPDFQSVKKRHEERYKAEPLTLDTLMHLCNQNNPDFSIEKAEDRPVPGFKLAHPPKSFRGFVSPTDPVDYYGPQVWEALRTEINSLLLYDPSFYTFPGGRYGTARALKERNLRFLNGYSLGELCHIVQLAIDKEILAYGKSGSVVPFKVSSKAEKDANARDKKPTFAGHRRQGPPKEGSEHSRRDTTVDSCGDHGSNSHHSGSSHLSPRSESTREDFIATWGRLREVLYALLTSTEWNQRILLLSNLKNEIRRHFNGVVLSETALGHTKLIDMVQDPKLTDLVFVDWRRNNPVLKLLPGATLHKASGPCVATPQRISRSTGTPVKAVSGTKSAGGSTKTLYADAEEVEALDKSRRVKTAPDEYLFSTTDRAIADLHINHYQITPLDFPLIPSATTETDYDITNGDSRAAGGLPGLDPSLLSPLQPLAHPVNEVSEAIATFGSSTDLQEALPDLELLLSQMSIDNNTGGK
ncbi:hypothetical protein Pmar_PMAR023053 [Perkinsus marinus ATCC 50983]|uniref:HTH OST-type domain-containing protein n=1 Tax=Perkinsus marinus (strain ATCC 50983 / TXsc) TaxID=423536 RepID=C5LI01_PERM5|nr:hypothetical protein Pmar_PMAR023053 [Perkinsus marinus ATCC 50983]EER03755.1 hypothetical protein Pmar_PMAR023053 [Perkinsus marinus ATCC 50983]|eukprot:XP_002771939.1 hypothetical protein Pmar_PMAR023053 [Perkinsus marinus ATCC 50983]